MSRSAPRSGAMTIGKYLLQRLQDHGIRDVFGIPGDYVLSFYSMLEESPINVVGCTREDCAGFAADAYARINGLGAVCVTYCVGGLSVANAIAGAYAEKSPVVLISGAPGLAERVNNPLLHHKVRDFHTQLEVFERLCVASAELTDPVLSFREIDRVLDAAVRFKRPVYMELPRDMVHVVPPVTHAFICDDCPSDPLAVEEAVEETCRLLAAAERPVIIAGIEVHRFGLRGRVLELAEAARIPIASTLLGKSVISEQHPLYLGVYEGAMGREEVTRFVEESDCVLLLGAFMTDLNLGIYTANLDPARCIYATSEQLRIRHHHYHGVRFEDFLDAVIARRPAPAVRPIPPGLQYRDEPYELVPDAPITIQRLIARLNVQLDDQTIVIADIGDSLFAATELTVRGHTEFISPAYYTSMGFSVPAALGALTARPDHRVIAICGDGAFQMTGMELSTIVRRNLSPLVFVLDNGGYGTERALHEGDWKYNEIHPWQYHRLPEILGGGTGYVIRTEGDLNAALQRAWNDRSGPSLFHVHLDRNDRSSALGRLAERLSKRV